MDLLELPYTKVLILGAIAAASAFIVTILIVLVCVGCQRKSKSKHAQSNGGSHRMDTGVLRQSKLNSMSKSDTRLHEMHRLPCNANGAPKNRPASMDLLLLHSRRSTSDLRSQGTSRQLPHIPTSPEGEERDHTYSEVGRRSSPTPRCLDDGLYESVGVKGPPPEPSAPPTTSANTQLAQCRTQSPSTNGNERGGGGGGAGGEGRGGVNDAVQDAVIAEYATIRKVRKLDRGRKKNGSEEGESVSSTESSSGTLHRKNVEPFHLPNFPKEAVFMGNGEQYIWKPPEETDIVAPGGPSVENGPGHACTAEISEMYSTVCKTLKKKQQQQQQQSSTQQTSGQTGSPPPQGAEDDSGAPQAWPPGGAPVEAEARGRACPQDEHCYEAVGEKAWPKASNSDPAYATIDSHRKREKLASNTLKPKKKPSAPPQGPGRALTCENFYEAIGDGKQGANAMSTTTIFTFNDGMEMYVTGL
ncbi:uncharacterized protein LOC103038476 isoform X1 [Astyanax mexicanus]|uniref:uncharacterized protein LOC103038476 isoform X1 n=2 Tax=Astyanax mexicanus TaxID=7994 RepID=UPI0020CAE69B|nr:uncharacterized protein LOC103038476 isoform X1 [Astyanax mexicanus]